MAVTDSEARFQHVLDRIEQATGKPCRRNGNQAEAHCPGPGHGEGDQRKSLSIAISDDSKVLLKCQRTCSTEEILAAAGLSWADVFPPRSGKQDGRKAPAKTRHFVYTDEQGEALFRVVRKEWPEGGKRIWQERYAADGRWESGLGDTPRVLYRLPELIEAVHQGREIFIPEGEPHVDWLWEHSLAATTNVMGAGKWRPAYSDILAGARVTILPDNDDPGHAHAQSILKLLKNKVRYVKILNLPGLPPKGDILDWAKTKPPAPAPAEEQTAAAERLRALADATKPAWALAIRGQALLAGEYLARKSSYPAVVSYWHDGVWNSGTVNVVSATAKIGKSTFTLQAGICFAAGLKFLDFQTRQCRAYITQTEVCDRMQIERFETMLDHMLGSEQDSDEARAIRETVAENLVFRDWSVGFHLWTADGNGKTVAQMYLEELRRDIERFEPKVLILDPYSKIFRVSGPMEIRSALESVNLLAEDLGLCVVIVSHWNKMSRGIKDPNMEQAYAGGAQLADDASSMVNLSYVPKTPIANSHAKVTFDSLRYRPPADAIVLRRPCPEARYFRVDHTVSADDVPDRKSLTGESELVKALEFGGPMTRAELRAEIMQRADCGRRCSYDRITEALEQGLIVCESTGVFRLA